MCVFGIPPANTPHLLAVLDGEVSGFFTVMAIAVMLIFAMRILFSKSS